MTLSIIVPTPDGGDLEALFVSIRPQIGPGDEVLIVGDTHSDPLHEVRALVESEGHRWLSHDAGRHAWGHPQINYGMTRARGDYLVFIDDDDVFTEDAFDHIRAHANGTPLMFRFRSPRTGLLWQKQVIQCGRIGGHEFVVPNIPNRLGTWTDRYEGDYDFIVSTLAKWPPDSLVWRPEVIALAR